MDSTGGSRSSVEAHVDGRSVERFLDGVERAPAPDRCTCELSW